MEKENSSLSLGQELMLKAMGMFLENMGSSPWGTRLSLGRVLALPSLLSTMLDPVSPRGSVREGERVRLSGLVNTIVTDSLIH